jgi:hypothetical protein
VQAANFKFGRDRGKKCAGLLKSWDFGYGKDMGADKTKSGDERLSQGGLAAGGEKEGVGAKLITEADRRRERAAEKLRENLARRKQQVRARRAGQADETDGLPAANSSDAETAAAKMDES